MKDYCYKIEGFTGPQYLWICDTLRRFEKRGVKSTIYRKAVYVHLNEDVLYTVVTNLLETCWLHGLIKLTESNVKFFGEHVLSPWLRYKLKDRLSRSGVL